MMEFFNRLMTLNPITETIIWCIITYIIVRIITKSICRILQSRITIYGGKEAIKAFNKSMNDTKYILNKTNNIRYITLGESGNSSINYLEYEKLLNNTIIGLGNPKNPKNIENIHRRALNMIVDISGFNGYYSSFKYKPYVIKGAIKRPNYADDFIITVSDIFPFKQTKIYVFRYKK